MRWRRAAVFALIVAAHVLIVWLFPSEPAPRERPEQQLSFATLLSPEPVPERPFTQIKRSAQLLTPARAPLDKRSVQTEPPPSQEASAAPAFTDWAKQAQMAADDIVKSDAIAARRTAALSRWKARVIPAPTPMAAPAFAWDYAATHRLETSAKGLVINLSDRCSLLISLSLMAVMGGCKLGELPVHGDLFMHMRDDAATSGLEFGEQK
jgi:hypothetical protein